MELEIPHSLAEALQGLVGAQSPLGRQLCGEGVAGSGMRIVSSRHFDGRALTLLYQLGQSSGEQALMQQLLALDNLRGEPATPAVPSLERLVPALTDWLARDAIDGWLYQRGKDGALLPWLAHSLRLVQPTDGQAYVVLGLLASTLQAATREAPADPRLRFTGMTWGLSFYAEDLPGRTLAELLADHGFYKECAEFKAAHDAEVQRFTQLQPQFGAQFTLAGPVWREAADHPGARTPPGALACLRLPEGRRARCVNDEALQQRRFDLAADPQAWRERGIASGFDRIPLHPYLRLFHLDWHQPVWAHVQQVQPYDYQPALRDRLVLPQPQRDLIDILTADRNFLVEDVVPGKSGGTTILCRGAPGLGKTLTAEVYAEVVGKPLYRVHSGQLGVTAQSVQASLGTILQRAARWDCVLLLDEADVYIRRRGNDLEHNAIVAEFLRTLEYFNGLLFMTTNRADDIDDAILSRCIAVIDYQPPGQADARRLWWTLSAQLGLELPPVLVEQLLQCYPTASGRDIKELLKLTGKFCRQRGEPLSAEAFAQCARFRGLVNSDAGHASPGPLTSRVGDRHTGTRP